MKEQVCASCYVAPRTPVEAELAHILADVLQMDKVGIYDNFYDLGGHSLLAVLFNARVQDHFGSKATLPSLLNAPTIAEFAERLTSNNVSAPETDILSALTPICAFSTKQTFYAGGTNPVYAKVAQHLGSDQPFYRMDVFELQKDRMNAGLGPHRCINEIAAYFVNKILCIQPTGPFAVGGGCEGAFVAFEVAQQLTEQGHTVSSLILWDTPAPRYINSRIFRRQFVSRILRHVLSRPLFKVHLKFQELTGMVKQEYMYYLTIRACKLYNPKKYEARLVLIRAAENAFPVESDDMGWGEFSSADICIHTVPGNHISFLTEHHKAFADCLNNFLLIYESSFPSGK